MGPWLTTAGISISSSTPLASIPKGLVSSATLTASGAPAQAVELDDTAPKELTELVQGDLADSPWQNQKYTADNAVCQGAALRRRMHHRRSNVSLGVCAVDLSGPHEPTPRPGNHIAKDPCHYFLVLSVRPDTSAETNEVGIQTADPDEESSRVDAGDRADSGAGSGGPYPSQEAEENIDDIQVPTSQAERRVDVPIAARPPPRQAETGRSLPAGATIPQPQPPKALIYVALLGAKSEAADAVKRLLAQVNNDHANYPTEIIFRVHSDQGGEFMNEDLEEYCADKGIHKTSTQGYDPNANSAETSVGIIKRRSRYLLSGNRLPTSWWGLSSLAAA